MKKIIMALGIFVAFFVSACSDSTSKQESKNVETNTTAVAPQGALDILKQKGVIRIGVFGDKPPFGYVDERGANQGYDIYFAKRIAKELFGDENKVEFVLVEAANRIEFLKSDKVDLILANFTKTKEREEQVLFTLPYMKVALGVVVPVDSVVTSIEDLKGKTLILNKGTTADIFFTLNHADIQSLKFDQNTETFAAMLDKRGDALSHDNTLLFAWVKDKPEFKVAIKELGDKDVIAGAVKKDNTELKQFVDDLIVKLADENFFHKNYEETLKSHFTDDVQADDIVIEGGKI
ncbi:ABC transporter substrate-binding protein [Helicobacter monodelphidis]|uniref:cysteine ABC transporter substrate-binding protein n=1 Tax=Helicobacter sp. 15-1451 TaxID=2004995 RepID=UPI000DCD18DF|nr:cysteine ABC transporter substrate-binding protein [Helicobacter sp. 15-1451]RAX59239.1 ABC transporter substrate-binding protein [Helicobacter sp. 15-1451]